MVDFQVEFKIDIERNGTFSHALADISDRVINASFSSGMDVAMRNVAPPAQMQLDIDNGDGAFNADDPNAAYYGLAQLGVLVRMRVYFDGSWHQRYIGHIETVSLPLGRYNPQKRITMTASCPTKRLYNGIYIMPLETSVTVDEPLRTMFDKPVITWPYARSFFLLDVSVLDGDDYLFEAPNALIDFETGYTTLDYAGDVGDAGGGTSPLSIINQMVEAEAGGRFYFDVRTGKCVFHNRLHDPLNSLSVSVTIPLEDIYSYDFGQDAIYNDVTVMFEPRTLGPPGSIVFSADSVPFKLSRGSARVITVRYRDPSIEAVLTSAIDVVQPERGTDLVANTQADGSGTDKTSDVGFSIDIGGQSSEWVLTNNQTVDVWITKLQLRGTPLSRVSRQSARAVDAASIYAYDLRPYNPVLLAAVNDEEFAQNYANRLLRRYANVAPLFRSVTLMASYSDALMTTCMTLDIGDQIALTDDWSQHNGQYVIVGVQESSDARSRQYLCTWILKSLQRENSFIVGQSVLDGIDGLAF